MIAYLLVVVLVVAIELMFCTLLIVCSLDRNHGVMARLNVDFSSEQGRLGCSKFLL